MKLRPYAAYKESGLPWLGRVPEHWDLLRAKYLMREMDTRSKDESGTLLSVSQYSGVTKRRLREGSEDPDMRSSSLVGYKVAKPGNLVSNIMLAWNGSLGISPMEGVVSPAYCVYRICIGEPWFFHHLLRSPAYKAEIKRRSRGVVDSRLRLYTDDFFRIPMLLPNVKEQQAIVRFVRYLDKRVNRFILNRRRLIEMLNEQKQAIINRAVTHGLDPGKPLKPSGIDWLGDIPAHWEVCRLRNVVSIVTSGSRGWSSYAADDGPLFIRIANLRRFSLDLRFDSVVRLNLPSTSEARRTRVKPNDLLISITAYIGSIAVVPPDFEEAYVSQHVARCPLRDRQHNPRWLGYVLLSEVGQTHGRLSLYGGTKDGLSLNDVKNYPMLLPPRGEQDRIVDYLEQSLVAIDHAIRQTESEINLIREYRTRLISDVVTGKVDVRHLAPPPGSEDSEELAEALEPLEEDIAEDMVDDEEPINESD